MKKLDRSMMRTSLTVPLSLLLVIPCVTHCQTSVNPKQNTQDALPAGRVPTTSELARCVGLNGLLTKPEDIQRWKAVMAALQHTASLGYSWEAMYAVGREFEFPSVKGTAPDWNTAAYYYINAANRGDYRAKYHLGSLYARGLVSGVYDPRNTGRMMMLSAENHGYTASTDAIDTSDHSNNVLPVLAGLAALLALAQGGSTTASAPNASGKSCLVETRTWISAGSSSHWQIDQHQAFGASCP